MLGPRTSTTSSRTTARRPTPQRQVELVPRLFVALDDAGYIVTDPMTLATSVPGIYAAGDLTRTQGTLVAAAAGLGAASMINIDLSLDLPTRAAGNH